MDPKLRPQRRFDGRLEEVAEAVGGGYCRLRMPLRLAIGVRGTVAGRRQGALEGGGGGRTSPHFQCIPASPPQCTPPVLRPSGCSVVRRGGPPRGPKAWGPHQNSRGSLTQK